MIKKFCLIAVALLLVFISCKKTTSFSPLSQDIPVFKDIYSLKDTQPDSAWKLFQAVADSLDMEKLYVSSKDHYAEFQILDAELHFKNFLPIQNDSALTVAYAHFDSLMPGLDVRWEDENVGYQKARACYTKAVVEEFK